MDAGGRATQDAVAEDAGCDPCQTGASTPQIWELIVARALRIIYALIIIMGVITSSGCDSIVADMTKGVLDKVFEPGPGTIEISLVASEALNPDANGRPSPLVTRLYELKSVSIFNREDFFTLYEQDTALLGDDMLVQDEFRLRPGETARLERELQSETRYIGIVAAYRDIEHAVWRKVVEIEANDDNVFTVTFEALSININKTR